MCPRTGAHFLVLKRFLTTHILCSHTVQLPPNYVLHKLLHKLHMVRMSINLCRFLPCTLGSSICATWSVIVILALSFTLFGTFFFYFYNDFTIRASLVNLHIISPRCLSPFLVYIYHIYMPSPWLVHCYNSF
jgi:hypothetical protein